MVKYLSIILLALCLISCKDQPVKTVYQQVDVPVYVVPKPPVVEQPVLAITKLTDAQKNDIGELSKAFNISLKQTMQYACQLKNIVDEYAILSAKGPSLVSPLSVASPFSLAIPSITQLWSSVTPITPAPIVSLSNVTKDCNK